MWRTTKTQNRLFNLLKREGEAFIVFDTETSGLSPEKDRVIQISAIKFLIEEGGRLSRICNFCEYINPGYYVSEKITELTGITNELLETKPLEEEVFPVIYDFFGSSPIVAAYNSKFDVSFLSEMYKRNGAVLEGGIKNAKGLVSDLETAVDILQMAKDLVDKKDTENFKLGTVCKLYGLDEGIKWHDASGDTEAAAQLMQVFISEYESRNEIPKNNGPKEHADISTVNFWKGFRGFSRIYVNTNLGTVFYDIRNQQWGEKEKGTFDIIDMERLREDAFKMYDVIDENELVEKVRKRA